MSEGMGDELRDLVLARTGLKREDLQCPREKSEMTPCVARDGDSAMTMAGLMPICVGCEASVTELLVSEKERGND
jgi:hypothetical protein